MANGVGWNRTESDGSGWGSYAPGAQRGTHDHAVHLGPGGEAHILMMRNLSHENTTACRQHASDKRGMWRVMRPAPLPGAGRIAYPIFRFSMACLLQAMANVSTRLSSSGPGHHHRDDKHGSYLLRSTHALIDFQTQRSLFAKQEVHAGIKAATASHLGQQ